MAICSAESHQRRHPHPDWVGEQREITTVRTASLSRSHSHHPPSVSLSERPNTHHFARRHTGASRRSCFAISPSTYSTSSSTSRPPAVASCNCRRRSSTRASVCSSSHWRSSYSVPRRPDQVTRRRGVADVLRLRTLLNGGT